MLVELLEPQKHPQLSYDEAECIHANFLVHREGRKMKINVQANVMPALS